MKNYAIDNWSQYVNTTVCIQLYSRGPIIGKFYKADASGTILNIVSKEYGTLHSIPISDIRTMWKLIFDSEPQLPNLTETRND